MTGRRDATACFLKSVSLFSSPPKPTSRRKAAFSWRNDMAASSYGEALARLLVHEGGNDDDPRDPGGRTSRGILQREWDVWRRTRPGLPADVWRAPQNEIEAIYRQNYWNALRCDDLPAGVDYAVFDYGVNSGIGRAAKVLQRLVATAVDGEVGPDTITAARRANAAALIAAICDERLAFLQGLRTWPTFGKGWGRRVREVRAAALAMVAKPASPPAVAPAAVPARGASSSITWFASLGRAIAGLFMRASGQRGDSMVRAHSASEDARERADDAKPPPWLAKAQSYLGFHERPGNRGIEEFIALAKCGAGGDPWCAIFVNACLEGAGVRGTRSAMARSFEREAIS
jgi:lysozyme family protein